MKTDLMTSAAARPLARIGGLRLLTAAGVVLLAATACTTTGPDAGRDGVGTGAQPSSGTSVAGEPAPSALQEILDGPGEELDEAATRAVAAMDTAEKAGQILVGQLGAAGTDPDAIRELNLGGVIVMGDAVPVGARGTHDVQALAARLDQTHQALSDGRDWTGITGVDQEGGLVARVKEPLVEWPTPMSYGAAAAGEGPGERTDEGPDGGAEGGAVPLARDAHTQLALQLAELGFTVDFAPSVDVTIGVEDPAIGARSFSSDPETVSALGSAATAGLLNSAVLPAPKHFPGHGSVTDDSHVTAPVQELTVAELEQRDWLPFRELLSGGGRHTPMVMMGHVIVPELEQGVPSSASERAYEELRSLNTPANGAANGAGTGHPDGYDGVVVTDALNMGALVERYGQDEAPVRALAAGADLLLMPSSVPTAREAIVEAVDSGMIPQERLDEAVRRVVRMLMWRDRVQDELASASREDLAAVGSSYGADTDAADVSRAVSAAAVTVVEGTCGEAIIEDSLQVTGAEATDRERFTRAAEAAGLSVGSGPVVNLVGTARGTGQGDVVVALDAPYGLAASSAAEDGALIALYGRTPGAFEALIDVLIGEAAAPGALPVEVGPWPAGTGCPR